MKLIIQNIKQFGTDSPDIVDRLIEYLSMRADDAKLVLANMRSVRFEDSKGIVIKTSDKDKKFIFSSRTNFIPLKDGDSRIKSTGRNYLESKRLTESQYKEMIKIFSDYLDYIGIECDVFIQEFDDDPNSKMYIRKGKDVILKDWLKPSNFTQERL